MARQTNAIATELDLKFAIDNNILLEIFPLSEYTGICITKQRVGGFVFVNETALSGLANNQLVKWDLLQSMFTTSLSSRTYNSAGGTFPYKIASQNGFTSAESASWFSISPTTGASGVVDFDLIINAKTDTGNRNETITFTENITLATIVITVTQNGINPSDNQSITLFSSIAQPDVCGSTTSGTFYIPTGLGFDLTTVLYTNSNGSTNAPSGFYRIPIGYWREWNGTSFVDSGDCN
jgi:hypothetical protein